MKKINFENIKNALSRDEMKKVMAGSGTLCAKETQACNQDSDCGDTTTCYCYTPIGQNSSACYTKH